MNPDKEEAMKQYDAIIIGTGQAGPSLATRLANTGKKVAVIERKLFGGTCVNNGCIPTKTLVASAYAAYLARRAGDFGVDVNGSIQVDMKRVKARKDAIVQESNQGVENSMKSLPNGTVYRGHARFIDSHTVAVGEEQLQASWIFINVGGRARIPDLPRIGRSLLYQFEHHASGFPSGTSCDCRRQLHRIGIRADVPKVRK